MEEGRIVHWTGRNGQVSAVISRDANGDLFCVTNAKTGAGLPLSLVRSSKSFWVE